MTDIVSKKTEQVPLIERIKALEEWKNDMEDAFLTHGHMGNDLVRFKRYKDN